MTGPNSPIPSDDKQTPNRLAGRLFSWVLLCSAVLALVLVCGRLWWEFRYARHSIIRDIEQQGELQAPVLSTSLWHLDREALNQHLNSLVRNDSIAAARVLHGDDVYLSAGITPDSADTIVKTFPLDRNGTQIGELQLSADLEPVYRRLLNWAIGMLVIEALMVVMVGIFVFLLFQYLVTRHLQHLAKYLRRLRLGNLHDALVLDAAP